MPEATNVRCTACGHAFTTVVAPEIVERVRRCGRCAAPALIVVGPARGTIDQRAVRRRAMAQRTLAIELRVEAHRLRQEARTARAKAG